jgi:hypothetical protein
MSVINEYNHFYDSKYRTSGTNASPNFTIGLPITLENPMHYFTVSIKSCDIPYSFKSLSAPYNTLRVRYFEDGVGDTTNDITLTEGNYSITSLLAELKLQLDNFILASPHLNVPDLIFTYDKNTGKVTLNIVKLSGANATSITLFWTDPNKDFLAEFFGFTGLLPPNGLGNTVLSYNALGVILSTNYISEINVNCSPISSIYIRSGTLTQSANNDEFLVEFQPSVSDILLKVPVNVPYGSWIIYENTNLEVRINNKVIDVVNLYLTHLSYETISLQGVHWRAQLCIKEIRPLFLEEMEKQKQENDAKIQEMENTKNELLEQLQGISGELRQKTEPIASENTTNIDQLKDELLQEVKQNRENNVN